MGKRTLKLTGQMLALNPHLAEEMLLHSEPKRKSRPRSAESTASKSRKMQSGRKWGKYCESCMKKK